MPRYGLLLRIIALLVLFGFEDSEIPSFGELSYQLVQQSSVSVSVNAPEDDSPYDQQGKVLDETEQERDDFEAKLKIGLCSQPISTAFEFTNFSRVSLLRTPHQVSIAPFEIANNSRRERAPPSFA